MNFENFNSKDFQKSELPSIFTVRREKNAPEQAACWQCDIIKEIGITK